MSRKSNVSAKLARAVSTFAIAGALCWIAGTDGVQAGSVRIKSGFARAGISKVSGLKQRTRINSRARTRFTVPKNTFQANKRLRVRPLNSTSASSTFKRVAPASGNQPLTIRHANRIRLQTLNTANRTRKFGCIVNINSVNGQKPKSGVQFNPSQINATRSLHQGQNGNRVVQTFNSVKGYGFIKPDGGGKDVFMHIPAVEKKGSNPDNKNITLNNGMSMGASFEFEAHAVPLIPERQRLVFLRLLGVSGRPATPHAGAGLIKKDPIIMDEPTAVGKRLEYGGSLQSFLRLPGTEDANGREHILLPRAVDVPFVVVSQNACYPDDGVCMPPEPEPLNCSNQSHPDC